MNGNPDEKGDETNVKTSLRENLQHCGAQALAMSRGTDRKGRNVAVDAPALDACEVVPDLLRSSPPLPTPPAEARGHLTMTIPPGISVLVTTISQASFLPLTLVTLDHFLLRPYGIHNLPTWVTVVTCLLSPLAAFTIQLSSGDLIVYVKAKRAGAVLPPHKPTWVPGAIHRVLGALKAEETAYLGSVSAD